MSEIETTVKKERKTKKNTSEIPDSIIAFVKELNLEGGSTSGMEGV